mmetsp:Transcript_35749/g.89290  ORF Transcript_35749/g.89290 Transcript_35749/m.89290 type:complete len:190 (-) Transcript_35749:339-908(-)
MASTNYTLHYASHLYIHYRSIKAQVFNSSHKSGVGFLLAFCGLFSRVLNSRKLLANSEVKCGDATTPDHIAGTAAPAAITASAARFKTKIYIKSKGLCYPCTPSISAVAVLTAAAAAALTAAAAVLAAVVDEEGNPLDRLLDVARVLDVVQDPQVVVRMCQSFVAHVVQTVGLEGLEVVGLRVQSCTRA